MNFAEKLIDYRKRVGLNKTELAQKLGVSPQYIMSIESERTKPPTEERCKQLSKILNLDSNEEYFFLFSAYWERLSKEEQEAAIHFSPTGSSVEQQKKKSPYSPETIIPKGLIKVPLLGTAPAGAISWTSDEVETWYNLPQELIKGKKVYLLKVLGDSLIDANIYNGDFVLVDLERQPENGKIVVAWAKGKYTIKKFYKKDNVIILRPANPKYEEQIYTNKNAIQIRGVVIWIMSQR